jgi:hypothetical protein
MFDIVVLSIVELFLFLVRPFGRLGVGREEGGEVRAATNSRHFIGRWSRTVR